MRVSPEMESLILNMPGIVINGGQAVRPHLTDKQSRSTAEALAKPIRSTRQQTRQRQLVAPGWAVEFTVPCVTVSEANQRPSHWAVRHRRFAEQKHAVNVAMRTSLVTLQTSRGVPLTVTFTRLGGKMLDSDNCAGAFKACRDQLAFRLGRDDGDQSIEWRYAQEPGNGPQGVLIRIASQPGSKGDAKR